jgi:hypothetical protein
MQQLDYQVLAAVFTAWAQVQHQVDTGEWSACDGKSIKGSVTDYRDWRHAGRIALSKKHCITLSSKAMTIWSVSKPINSGYTEALPNNRRRSSHLVAIKNRNKDMDGARHGKSVCLMELQHLGMSGQESEARF